MIKTDILVIGSGIAGLTFAIKVAQHFPDKKITIITKSAPEESNTKYAQGGIAVVWNGLTDNFEKHIQDTIVCGDGLCDERVVRNVVVNGPKRLLELIEWGTDFDKDQYGNLDLGLEGGHSQNRVVHHKDHTGFEIERAILAKANATPNITMLDYHFAFDLIIQNNNCFGAYVLNEKSNEVETYIATKTFLAPGGIGQVYGHTTNPLVATGDGIAMAHRAGARIKDMEFIQFHPTALYNPKSDATFLISEALRGYGAYLRNKNGERFMWRYDHRGELASRDIISQCIEKELKTTGEECVFLDATHLDFEELKKHFPTVYNHCMGEGINIETDWIPVKPAQHYVCGGVRVDINAQTNINNLFACGECAYTGLHGANRLASNSLLEALVFSDNAFQFLKQATDWEQYFSALQKKNAVENLTNEQMELIKQIRKGLQYLMQQKVGIVRNDTDLKLAQKQIANFNQQLSALQNSVSVAYFELKNMLDVSDLIIQQSLVRTENRGGFVKVIGGGI